VLSLWIPLLVKMRQLIELVDAPHHARDPHSKAILATDRQALQAHRVKLNQAKEIKRLTVKVEELETRLLALENRG